MNKLITPIFVVAIIVTGIGVAFAQPAQGPYGDAEDSPFGIFDPYEVFLDRPNFITRLDINEYLKDLGVKWVQAMPREDVDELNTIAKSGANICSRIIPSPKVRREGPDASYKEFTRNIIRKYKDKIKYWEADTEPESCAPPAIENGEGWCGHPEKYADFLKVTYEIIKEECPDCQVVFGGLGGAETGLSSNSYQARFLNLVLKTLEGKYFDAFEFKQHYHRENEYPELKNKMEIYGKILSHYGIDIYKIPIFIETAMYSGRPDTLNEPALPYQSELEEAAGLVKTYIFGIAQGIDKIFWNNVVERGPEQRLRKEIFCCYGLVHNPQDDGLSHKKLAYYTYKKMVDILEGSDWNNIQTIQEKDGIYVYKFTKQGKSIWVAWDDNPGEKEIMISGIFAKQVKITEAMPKYESGKDIKDYNAAFKTYTKVVMDGKVNINLGELPVFVEGME